jgi:hypothetical protein
LNVRGISAATGVAPTVWLDDVICPGHCGSENV